MPPTPITPSSSHDKDGISVARPPNIPSHSSSQPKGTKESIHSPPAASPSTHWAIQIPPQQRQSPYSNVSAVSPSPITSPAVHGTRYGVPVIAPAKQSSTPSTPAHYPHLGGSSSSPPLNVPSTNQGKTHDIRVASHPKHLPPLDYPHRTSPRFIHRDFKSSNILLEHDFTPKVSYFGLARTALGEGNEHISTRIMGTFGYVAAEYAMTGHLLVNSDVYSYGIVLLELLTGRKPVDMSRPPGQENLVAWACSFLTNRDGLEAIIDLSLGSSIPFDIIAKVAAIAYMCVQPEVDQHPYMGEVVQALKLVCDEGSEFNESRSFNQDLHIQDTEIISRASLDMDIDPVLSTEQFTTSARYDTLDASSSFRWYSSSGPLKVGKTEQNRERGLSTGSSSEHCGLQRFRIDSE